MTHINFAMTTLLNGICQGTILAAVMWVLLKLLPRLNSTTRFTVLWLTLLAVAALPTGLVSPRVSTTTGAQPDSLPITTTNAPVATTFAPVEIRHSELKAAANPESHPATIPESNRESASHPGFESPGFESRGFESALRNAAFRTSSSVMEPVVHPLIRIRSGKVLAAIEILWALLSLMMLVRLAAGYRELRRLKSRATPAPDRWELRLRRLCAINGIRRQTRLLISSQIAGPVSLGFFDPAILIPWAFLDTLSDAELDHIVMHELAHLHRRDDWTNLAQRFIEAVLPIQPAVYWLGHRMSLEREMACDDWVIAATGTAKPYAASLTKVAELSQFGPAGILAAGAAGSRSQLLRRVHHMLDRTRNATPKLVFGPLVGAVAAVAGLIYLGAQAPQMIAFAQNPANENSRQEITAPKAPKAPKAPNSLQAPVAPIAALTSGAPLAAHASLTPIAVLTASASPAAQAATSPLAPPAPLAPSAPLAAMAPPAPLAPAASQQSGETHMEFRTQNGWTSLKVKIDGAIEFTDDDHDVKSLSPNGRFTLEEGGWLSGRGYDVRADATGNLTKTYSVGRTSKPLDDEGRAWLGRLLPQVIRDTGIAAGPRVTRILRQGGPPAVIAEIGLIHSDGSKRIYLEQLFSQATLNTEQLKDSSKLIRGISSDGDKAQVLTTVDEKYFTGDLRPYLFDAAESINSDGDKRRVLSDIVKKDAGNTESLVRAARAARHISSDGDKAEVLVEIADPYRANDELHMVYFEAVNSISSDGDHARVLSKLLEKHGDDGDTLARVLRSAEKISSDGDKARVLKEAVSSYRDDQPARKAFFDAANSISSDGDHQQVLVTLIHRQGIGTETLGGIANSAQRISSDGDKARVLVDLTAANTDAVRDAFFSAADSIHSDGDRSRVLTAVLDKPGTSSAMAIGAIQSATGISSEGDKARVLLNAANRYSNDPGVNAALCKAVESLHSDGEYRAVMSEIERHRGSI
jgi:beta-lactamase regulating signal transducer with metallopeptidase domain